MDKANQIANFTSKRVTPVADLDLDVKYKILNLKAVNTKYGRNIVAELEEEVVFLPKRMAALQDEDLAKLLEDNVSLMYLGCQKVGKYNNVNIIKFVE